MKRLFSSGLLLLIAGLAACSGPTGVEPTVPAPAADPVEPSSAVPADLSTLTPEPLPKILRAPEEAKRIKQFADAPDRDLFRLTKELVPGSGDITRTVIGDAPDYQVGRTDTFWLVDLTDTETYQSEFTLVWDRALGLPVRGRHLSGGDPGLRQ